MTLAHALVTVSSESFVRDALVVAQRAGLGHLLVVDRGKLAGVVSRSDLIAVDGEMLRVCSRISHCPWVIEERATLAEAAVLMSKRNVDCLPVVRDKRVTGVITRGDLRRLGLDDEAFVELRDEAA